MIDTVFISDLHLHPEDEAIQERFTQFLKWVEVQGVRNLYILGDFFHAWAGDDAIDAWSESIADQIKALGALGIKVYYMQGNRDFLLGKAFAKRSGWVLLSEPTIITLGEEPTLLVHGDRYCTEDSAHQRFRALTRNSLFSALFLCIPLRYRKKIVDQVRHHSQNNPNKSKIYMDVVEKTVVEHMQEYGVKLLIHGHTHKPGISHYESQASKLARYVLSDWDDNPQILCYNETKGLYFALV